MASGSTAWLQVGLVANIGCHLLGHHSIRTREACGSAVTSTQYAWEEATLH